MPTVIQPPVLMFLLSAIALIVLPHAWNIAPSIILFFYGLVTWRAIGIWHKKWLPNKWVLFILTMSGIALIYQQHLGVFGRNAGTLIFITALGLKLLEIKSSRDIYFICFLAFIVAATLFLYQQSIGMALYIVAACVSLLATLVVIHMQTIQAQKALRVAATLLMQALPLGIAFFVLFPRLEAPHWTFLQDKAQVKTGLSETLEPGAISDLAMSDELVFRVKFSGSVPSQPQRYWRGPVFSLTDGKKWLPLPRKDMQAGQAPTSNSGEVYDYTLLMEPQEKNWVFALDMPSLVVAPLKMSANYQLTTDANPGIRSEYALKSYADYSTGAITVAEQQENLQLPPNVSPAIINLVQALKGFDATPNAYIQQVLNHFRTQQFYYSLTPPLMENNPIDTFLFKTRTGFCSHYATAFVYLMRVAHIPARVVSGYQGGELNKVGGFLEIKQADAHAWTEVWLAKSGWTRVDPTVAVAPERVEQGVNVDQQVTSGALSFTINELGRGGQSQQLLKQLRQAWQNADYSWQRWVINYNNSNQANFLSSLGLHDMRSMLIGLMVSLALLTIGLFWWITRQPGNKIDPASKLYQQFMRKLSKLNLYKRPNETANSFAARIIAAHPQLSQPVTEITTHYINLRYGKNPGAAAIQQLQQAVKLLQINKRTGG